MPEFYDFYQRDESGVAENYTHFTDGESDVEIIRGAKTYTYKAIPITRSAIMKSGRMGDNEAEITFSIREEFAKSRLLNRAEDRYWVSIWRSSTATSPFWRGKMKAIRPTRNTIPMVFTGLIGSLRIYGLPANYQTTCRHSLYDDLCKVKKDGTETPLNSRTVTITKIDGRQQLIEVTDEAMPPWPLSQVERGYLEQGGRNYRITGVGKTMGSTTTDILYLTRTTGLDETATTTVYRGCDKRFTTCGGRFSNQENFGGFPYLSPYEHWGQSLTTLPALEGED